MVLKIYLATPGCLHLTGTGGTPSPSVKALTGILPQSWTNLYMNQVEGVDLFWAILKPLVPTLLLQIRRNLKNKHKKLFLNPFSLSEISFLF